jgi:hypothetical protein
MIAVMKAKLHWFVIGVGLLTVLYGCVLYFKRRNEPPAGVKVTQV